MAISRACVACCLLLITALCTGAAAQNTASSPSAQPDMLGNPPPPAPGVDVHAWFPNHPRLQFPLGETVDVVVGFSNGGEEAYNVTALIGSLHSSAQWNLWVQNFTAQRVNVEVKPGEQTSVEYSFQPDSLLQVREFQVAVHVYYQGLTLHHSLAFNKTVDIIELPKWIDFQLLGLWGILLAVLAGLGFLLYRYALSVGWVRQATKRRGPRVVNMQTADSADQSQWLKGTFYDSHARAKAKSTGRITKKVE
mmetsp:Transcript_19686/g.59506  ORF Transcript_19686/g.59506 Transcript_19686/m.59506 type:complete len:251 (+) Transcript_19686:93-845(+)|eukprot:CAMPEP_0206135176 /NCGR_PEP_ID=MMETSP1473-20131121/517_1 /ASSEMBLY_ACC=CAM_ASM_001109 /TAXON_ID=1461547 /ORGANISM="Stichococcus sp, Strain RCC1054" /LENGTH=250 /DNA_ID=CAMNT_0053526935 /DNA_START=19 /DNA_END=771 /DNA_ORIENTATION=+